jgi:hypothetical protein
MAPGETYEIISGQHPQSNTVKMRFGKHKSGESVVGQFEIALKRHVPLKERCLERTRLQPCAVSYAESTRPYSLLKTRFWVAQRFQRCHRVSLFCKGFSPWGG